MGNIDRRLDTLEYKVSLLNFRDLIRVARSIQGSQVEGVIAGDTSQVIVNQPPVDPSQTVYVIIQFVRNGMPDPFQFTVFGLNLFTIRSGNLHFESGPYSADANGYMYLSFDRILPHLSQGGMLLLGGQPNSGGTTTYVEFLDPMNAGLHFVYKDENVFLPIQVNP